MSLAIATPTSAAARQRQLGAGRWVIGGFVARRALRGAIIWGLVFGIWVLATIKAFLNGYPTISSRQEVARSFGAFSMFLGYPRHLETVTGFTTWRVLVVIVTIAAIWGLMTSTGLLRGEEDAGRWEVLLAGPISRRRATLQALSGLGATILAMFATTAILTLAAGQTPGARFTIAGSLLFALAVVAGAAMFAALGALLSQVSATRGQAMTLGSLMLGGAYALRMVADSNTSLGWLRWASPIGWLEELQPLRETQPLALLPVVAEVVLCSAVAVLLAGRRDLNASVLRENAGGGPRLARWVVGPVSLTLRTSGGSALAWLIGAATMAAVYGSLVRSATNLMSSSSMFATAFSRLGVRQMSAAYLGVVFLMVALLISLIAAGQMAAVREEEASGRLDNLLVRPVHRLRWLVSRLCISSVLILLIGITTGVFAWLGAASQHTGVSLSKLIEAGVNASVPAAFVLGFGCLVFGVLPRFTSVAGYAIVAWSFLVDLLGALVKGNDWIRDSSLFSHIKLAPAATPDWGQALVLLGLSLAAAALGAIAFARRDLEYT